MVSNEHGVVGEGKGLDSEDAKIGALCESTERVLAMTPDYRRSLVGHSANSLRREGIAVPKIEAGLRDCFSEELMIDWIEAKLFPNTQASLPAELVWYHYAPCSGFRAFDMRQTIGLAAGASEAEAFSNGLLECIERDAYALLMRCRLSCPAISANDIAACRKDITNLLTFLDAEGIEVHLKWLQLDYPLPIAHAFFRDRMNRIPAHSHGCSAALTPEDAISRALFEALQMHHGLARFASVHWQKMAARIETSHSHPRYAWGDPLYSATLKHLANTAETPTLVWPGSCPSIETLCEHLEKSGRRIFWSVLGEKAGLTVVRVFLEGSVSPDNRQEDNSQRLAYWVRQCKILGPYTDPILT